MGTDWLILGIVYMGRSRITEPTLKGLDGMQSHRETI